jgi:Na+-transporting methylmalonyl-CoA/oxaloacetate decarboxylase gamma subunit
MIEVARAIVLVLGLSVIFAFVHLVLAFIEDIPEPEREMISQENTDIEKTPNKNLKTLSTKHKSCSE